MWQMIPLITGGFSAIAFVVAIIVAKLKSDTMKELEELKSVPDDQKLTWLEAREGAYSQKTDVLDAVQRERLLVQQVVNRHQRYKLGLIAAVICFALLLATIIAITWVPAISTGGVTPTTVPSSFDLPATKVCPPSLLEPLPVESLPKTPDMSGFKIVSDARLVDLRQINNVPKRLETTRHSPANFRRTLSVIRLSEGAGDFVARFGTSGAGVDAKCITHHAIVRFVGIRSNSKRHNLLKNFDLVIDVSKEKIGVPFDIEIEATSWNAFQGSEEWVGFDAYEVNAVDRKVLTVLFPKSMPFSNLFIQPTREGTDDVAPIPDNLILREDEAKRGFSWEVERADPALFLETRWTW